MTFKQKIHLHCITLIKDKINLLQQVLADLKESGANETKSTAGDKHETALAMLQIEQANKRNQLNELVKQKDAIEKVNPTLVANIILNGSLVKTNKGCFYICTSLGKINVDGVLIMAISLQSPLAQKFLNKVVGQTIEMNSLTYTIEELS